MSSRISSRSFFDKHQLLLDFFDSLPASFLTRAELDEMIFNLLRGSEWAADLKTLYPLGVLVTPDLHMRFDAIVEKFDKALAIVLNQR